MVAATETVAIWVATISLLGVFAGGVFTFVTAKRANKTALELNKTEDRKVDTDEFVAFREAQTEELRRIREAHRDCERELSEHRKQIRDVWKIVREQEGEVIKCKKECRELRRLQQEKNDEIG